VRRGVLLAALALGCTAVLRREIALAEIEHREDLEAISRQSRDAFYRCE